jgi:hypothetical protein
MYTVDDEFPLCYPKPRGSTQLQEKAIRLGFCLRTKEAHVHRAGTDIATLVAEPPILGFGGPCLRLLCPGVVVDAAPTSPTLPACVDALERLLHAASEV